MRPPLRSTVAGTRFTSFGGRGKGRAAPAPLRSACCRSAYARAIRPSSGLAPAGAALPFPLPHSRSEGRRLKTSSPTGAAAPVRPRVIYPGVAAATHFPWL